MRRLATASNCCKVFQGNDLQVFGEFDFWQSTSWGSQVRALYRPLTKTLVDRDCQRVFFRIWIRCARRSMASPHRSSAFCVASFSSKRCLSALKSGPAGLPNLAKKAVVTFSRRFRLGSVGVAPGGDRTEITSREGTYDVYHETPCDVDDGRFDRSLLEHGGAGPARRYASSNQHSRPPWREAQQYVDSARIAGSSSPTPASNELRHLRPHEAGIFGPWRHEFFGGVAAVFPLQANEDHPEWQ